MKILYFNYMTTSFASILRSLEYARGAADQGHEVTLCYLHPWFRPPEWYYGFMDGYRDGNLRIHHPPRPAGPEAAAGLPRRAAGKVVESRPSIKGLLRQAAGSLRYVPRELALVDQVRPDVLLARPDQVFSFLATARLRGLPLVLECDGPVEELDRYWGLDSRWVEPLDTWRARRAQALLYISGACRELWTRKRIPAERLFYAPNAAHPQRFKPLHPARRRALRRSLGLDGSKVIGFSGNLRSWHGVDNLIRAALPILASDPDVRLLFIGSVDDPEHLARLRVPEEIRRTRFVFTGPLPYSSMGDHIDVADLIAIPYPPSDLFYFSPMKLFEAMSLGKLIVAPRQGQIEEMLGDLESPILYPPGDGRGLREGLEAGLRRLPEADPDRPLGPDARARIEDGHTWGHRGRVVAEACEYASRSVRKGGAR